LRFFFFFLNSPQYNVLNYAKQLTKENSTDNFGTFKTVECQNHIMLKQKALKF